MSDQNQNGVPEGPTGDGNPYGVPGHNPGIPGGYPDASVPPVYPASPVPGDQQAVSHAQQYAGYGAPSAFAGPPRPSTGGPGGLAIAALVVGIIAFLTGLIPILGIVLAAAAIVLGIIAVRRKQGRPLSITGLVLSGIAFVTGIVVLLSWAIFIPAAIDAGVEQIDGWSEELATTEPHDTEEVTDHTDYSLVDGQIIETPCWSYNGPQYFVNNISDATAEACVGTLELWGEEAADGDILATGSGAVYGQVGVEPIRVSTATQYAPGTDPVAIVDAIQDTYFAPQGEIETLHEAATLGGMPADITRIDSDADHTETKAFITAFAPAEYTVNGEAAQLFIISIVTPYDNGDELIQQVLDTWEWK